MAINDGVEHLGLFNKSSPMVNEINQPAIIEPTRIVKVDGQFVDIPADVKHTVRSSLIVVSDADALREIFWKPQDFRVVLNGGVQFEVMLASHKPGSPKFALTPVQQPVTVIDKGGSLQELRFSVLNLPGMHGPQFKTVQKGNQEIFIPSVRVAIPDGEWHVEVEAVPEIRDIEKKLTRERGIGVTYTGRITRYGAGDFTRAEVEPLLNALRDFLSFSCGSWCGFNSVKAFDQAGQQSWVRWGAPKIAAFDKNRLSWFNFDKGTAILSKLFPVYWNLVNTSQQETINQVIYSYLTANESAMNMGVIMAQAALERLSLQILKRDKKPKGHTGEFIRKALVKSGLDSDIPACCRQLRALQQSGSRTWEHGPHAIVDLRNNLIHPDNRIDCVTDRAYYEGCNLGLWYVEMLLLKQLGYQGPYRNRLATRYNGEDPFPLFPWA